MPEISTPSTPAIVARDLVKVYPNRGLRCRPTARRRAIGHRIRLADGWWQLGGLVVLAGLAFAWAMRAIGAYQRSI